MIRMCSVLPRCAKRHLSAKNRLARLLVFPLIPKVGDGQQSAALMKLGCLPPSTAAVDAVDRAWRHVGPFRGVGRAGGSHGGRCGNFGVLWLLTNARALVALAKFVAHGGE
jgi:hypothetical protein